MNREVLLKGWVRTRRGNNQVAFIAVNDGTIIHSIQVVADLQFVSGRVDEKGNHRIQHQCERETGRIHGKGTNTWKSRQRRLKYWEIQILKSIPCRKKGTLLNFSGKLPTCRFRTNTFGAVFRIRHALAYAIHKYYNDKGFFYLHTPIITASDAEGAGAMFKVTTLDLDQDP